MAALFFRCLFFNTFGSIGAGTDSFNIVPEEVNGLPFDATSDGTADVIYVEDCVDAVDTVGEVVVGTIFDAVGGGTGGNVYVEGIVGVVDTEGEVVVVKIFDVSVIDSVGLVDTLGEVVVDTIFGKVGGPGGVSVEDFEDFKDFKDEGFNFLAAEAAEATEDSVEELFSDSFRFCDGMGLGSGIILVFLATCIAQSFLPTKALDNNVSWMIGTEGNFLLGIFTAGAGGEETLLASCAFSRKIISSIVGGLTEKIFLRASFDMVV